MKTNDTGFNLQMTNNDTVNDGCESIRVTEKCKIGKTSLIIISHVHPAVKHNITSTHAYDNTAPPDV